MQHQRWTPPFIKLNKEYFQKDLEILSHLEAVVEASGDLLE